MRRIEKLLVANRGEIAVRVMRAAKDAGLRTVAVYADQDRNALHVRLADEAYSLAGNTAATTYLSAEKILAVAGKSEANAVHPGYGFLAENSLFAQSVIDSGLIWIGPPPTAIDLLGDKVSARKVAERVGAPLAPGTLEPVNSVEEVSHFAKEFGFPLAIKAAYGGGGRGLRVVRNISEIPDALESAQREALAAFGRDECFVEKFLEKPRHVETQCLADFSGKVVVISTRDCTLQRRHQKLVEEAPAPFLSPDEEAVIYQASKKILRECGYVGAGTVEFLIGVDRTISFLEVNTRLQVEHPVSEECTGIDLVREQFRIAEGGLLDYSDPQPRGHSFEFRINGEDPGSDFLPMAGPILSLNLPTGPGIRIDSGYSEGDEMSGSFDSLIAKLIVTGANRQDALDRARRALREFEVTGLPTVLPFHRKVVSDSSFSADSSDSFLVHTTWIEDDFVNDIEPWSGSIPEDVGETEVFREVIVEVEGRRLKVGVPAQLFEKNPLLGLRKAPKRKRVPSSNSSPGTNQVLAPMQATVIKVLASDGDLVARGDLICVLEAMKMEQGIVATQDGTVTGLKIQVGDSVAARDLVCLIEEDRR